MLERSSAEGAAFATHIPPDGIFNAVACRSSTSVLAIRFVVVLRHEVIVNCARPALGRASKGGRTGLALRVWALWLILLCG
ncbi:MAG: hypothetical protein ACREXY_26020, partial [Gammaproteobacteria bacterium]